MGILNKLAVILLAVVLVIAGMAPAVTPVQAATCATYHFVSYGESLSIIGAAYGVPWRNIASANGIVAPWTIFAGQKLCIPAYGTGGGTVPVSNFVKWSYRIFSVQGGTSVTIQTYNFPDNTLYTVSIGCWGCSGAPTNVGEIDSGAGGSFKRDFSIPSALSGYASLYVRITQRNGKYQDVVFNNSTSSGGSYTGGYVGIPTISIVSVVRNTSVTIKTYNFPSNLIFNVLMGPMGTRGVGGYLVGTIDSANGANQTVTFNIPSALVGSYQISIRTQNTASGYFSYNWFYNSTAN